MILDIFETERLKTENLSKPLRDALNISTIGYRKFLADGRNYGFSTNRSLDESFATLLEKSSRRYSREVTECSRTGYAVFLRTGQPEKNDPLLWSLYKTFETWNTLAIYQKNEHGFIEGYYFACKPSEESFIQHYDDFLPYIHNYILELKKNVISCLQEGHIKHDLFPYINLNSHEDDQKNSPDLSFSDNIYLMLSDGDVVRFPLREAQCLVNFVLGRQYKEIARELEISSRSVETYVQRAMRRTNTTDRLVISRNLMKEPLNLKIINKLFL